MSEQAPPPDVAVAAPPGHLYGVLAEFDDTPALLRAAAKVRDAGYRQWDTFTPIPIHGLDGAMGIRRTLLPWVVFGAGIAGGLGGLAMQWWMNVFDYPYVVSGKPLLSIPAFVPIIFEVVILLAAITAFVGMLMFNKLPQLYHTWFASRAFASRVTSDRFFIGIEARDPQFDLDRAKQLLADAGSTNVEVIAEPDPPQLPAWVRKYAAPVAAVLLVAALVPPLLVAKARVTPNQNTRVQLIPDMDRQPRFLPQSANSLFLDNRSMRPLVPGTVAAGWAELDPVFYRGIADGEWTDALPVEVDRALLVRGQQRYDIFCMPCHGWDGEGRGPAAVTGQEKSPATWVMPTSLTGPVVRERPDGHIFNTITNGIRTMAPYGDQIRPADRWAIVAYMRALQLSQAVPLDLLPPGQREQMRR